MSAPKKHYSAAELAAMKLPDLPGTERGILDRAKRENWSFREVDAKGGKGGKRREYALTSLPEAARNALIGRWLTEHPATPAAVATAVAPIIPAENITAVIEVKPGVVAVRGLVRRVRNDADLTDAQRAYRDAALVLCRAVDGAVAATGISVKGACLELATRIVSGEARPELLEAADATYLKKRAGGNTVAAQQSRLSKIFACYQRGQFAGDAGLYLVPGKREKEGHNPVHIAAFLRAYCRPARPSVAEAYREMAPFLAERGLPEVSYGTVCKIEKSLPVTVKYRGRVTGSEWRALKPYVDRDVSMFHANDIWVGDGHSFKAKVQHPIHGQPFTPEITVILDWVSRKIVGWSVALSESTVAVSDAFRHAQITTRARPLIYYSDNGAGQTGKMIDCPIAGTLARQGIAHETGIPGNPQGRGILERLWQVVTIPLARTYPTCTWRGADENYTSKMLKALNRKDGGGIQIPTFRQLLDDLAQAIADYNLEHEHRELNGNTPEDEYQARLDKDSIVFGPSDAEIHALWMPEVVRKPQRGLVSLFGNEYFKRDLVDVLPEGSRVRVRYDLHNPEKVWLLTMEGQYLGEALFNGNRRAAFPVSRMEQLRAERAAGKIKRGEGIIAEAQAELGDVYDLTPAVPMPIPQPDAMPVAIEEPMEDAGSMSHQDMVMWLYGAEDDQNNDASEAAAG